MSTATLRLRAADGSTYDFPPTFDLVSASSIRNRVQPKEIAFSHGGRDIADGKIKPKFIEVEGLMHAATEAAYQTAWDLLTAACLQEDQEFLYDGAYFIKVKRCAAISPPFVPGLFNKVSNARVKFFCEDPRWYSETLTTLTFAVNSDPFTALVTNSGTLEVSPAITLQRTTSYEQVLLSNLDGQSESIAYADTGFVGVAGGGTSVDMSSEFALATRGATDVRQYFEGSWPGLGAGANNYQIEGLSGGTIIFAFREARA